jgi:TonB-dependent receptor
MHKPTNRRTPLAQGIALALGISTLPPALAQEGSSVMLDEIIVTGVRKSLTDSMDLKRSSDGVVDAIVAEDIGKFPDTNLAEALQRITGVSIDRSGSSLGAQGEGQRITVRGIGGDFNLVLLNGRQMPVSSVFATTITSGRSFDFSNLASEAVRAVEVYKTSMSSIPTGGIGATVNVRTARPFDVGDRPLSIGAKAVHDTSDQDSAWTPEISGIYSNVFADGQFGITVSAIYQKREFGYNQASTANGWLTENRLADWQRLPAPDGQFADSFENIPAAEDLYSLAQNLVYSRNDLDRERLNGQLVLQWAPTDSVTATLDYTYSELEIQQRTHDISAWFIQCGICASNADPNVSYSSGTFTDGPVVTPLIWSEEWFPTPGDPNSPGRDVSIGGAMGGWKTELDSIGFNLDWVASDSLRFALDFHSSTSESGRASPYGVNSAMGLPGFRYGNRATVDYSSDLPVLNYDLNTADGGLDPSRHEFSGASWRSSLSKQEINQGLLSGTWDMDDSMSLDFGVSLTETKNRTAFRDSQDTSWSGTGTAAEIPDDIFTITGVRRLFSGLPGSSNPDLFDQMFLFNIPDMYALREEVTGFPSAAVDDFDRDLRTKEESVAAYLQWRWNFELGGRNANLRLGMRYEQTDVTSSALVPIPDGIYWASANEYFIDFGDPNFTELEGDYDNWLPNIDFNVEVTDNVILRASYGKTIGRQSWQDIQGGQSLTSLVRREFGQGSQGDPGLLPLESDNYDLSAEWYYAPGSYVAAGYFRKDVKNYVATSTIDATPFDLPHPGQGQFYNDCQGLVGDDQNQIRQCIFDNFGESEFVDVARGRIYGVPGEDPSALFVISVPTNSREVAIDGWELAIQHMFGDSGFGVSANYTMVDADIGYDDASLEDQFAILGLSDSANLVAFYDKNDWIVRLAWNWRDEFLQSTTDATGNPNPVYTEEYQQLDAIVSYTFGNGITVFAEGFNLTDEYLRLRGRRAEQLQYITKQGPRYGLGVRWVF